MISAITLYQISIGLHSIFAISFIGVAGANGVIGPMARENPQHALFALKVTHKIHNTVVLPGIIGVFITGLYQSIDGPWGSGDWWLTLSVLLFLVMAGLSILVLHPANNVAIAELESQGQPGPPSERFQQEAAKLAKIGPAMGIMLIIVAFLMSAKPF